MIFLEKYVIATNRQIRSWSFGEIRQTREAAKKDKSIIHSSLDEQRIFGPRVDMQCECKKYVGIKHKGIICDRCGVKVSSSSVRWERMGHINLKQEMEYSLGNETQQIQAFPVMPARYRESKVGRALNDHYEQIVESNQAGDVKGIDQGIAGIQEILLPLMETAYGWGLPETDIIAHGLVLTQPEEEFNIFDVL